MKKYKQSGVYEIVKEAYLAGFTSILDSHKFMGAMCYITGTNESLWWSYEKKTFTAYQDKGSQGASTHSPHKSYRSFLKFLRKNPQFKGKYELILVSRYYNNDITAK